MSKVLKPISTPLVGGEPPTSGNTPVARAEVESGVDRTTRKNHGFVL
jgi:hypothetical protein